MVKAAGLTAMGLLRSVVCSTRLGLPLCARVAKPLPDTSVSWPAAAEETSRRCMSAGEVPVAFCRMRAMAPATNGTAWEVPVRILRQ